MNLIIFIACVVGALYFLCRKTKNPKRKSKKFGEGLLTDTDVSNLDIWRGF